MASPQELIASIQASVEKIGLAVADLTARLAKLEQDMAGLVPALQDIDTKLTAIAGQLTPE